MTRLLILCLALCCHLQIHFIFAQTNNNGNSSAAEPPSSATIIPSPRASSSSPSPTSTPNPKDPCADGRCKPAGKSKDCLVISKTWMYRDFNKEAYLPVDLSAYFRDRFDNFKSSSFPNEFNGSAMFVDLFGNQDWSYWGKYYDRFNMRQAGCALPMQRYYLVWALIDIYEFYQTNKDECATGPPLEVCALTLDQRSNQVISDLNNKTLCNAPPEYIKIGMTYADRVRNHPFKSTSPTCVDGSVVEDDAGKCGWFTQYAACMNQDTCPGLLTEIKNDCPNIISRFNTAYNPNLVSSDSIWNDKSMISIIVPSIIGGIIALAMVGGLVALKLTRRKSTDVLKTLTRTLSRHPRAEPYVAPTVLPSDNAMRQSYAPSTVLETQGDIDSLKNSMFSTPHRSSYFPNNDVNRMSYFSSIDQHRMSHFSVDQHMFDPHRASTIMYVDPDGNPMSGPIIIGNHGTSPDGLVRSSFMNPTIQPDEQYVVYVDEHGNQVDLNGVTISATAVLPETVQEDGVLPELVHEDGGLQQEPETAPAHDSQLEDSTSTKSK